MSDDPRPEAPAPGTERKLEPGTRIGRFLVEAFLARGGMGEVYRAWDATLERAVALKALRLGEAREAGATERFRREALALAQLNHPNVCQIHDWVDSPEGTFIAMEFIEGRTLDQAAAGLKVHEKLQVIRSMALALEAAHGKGLVHRDLKPGNVMVAQGHGDLGLRVKVLDFGLARLADPQGPPGTQPLPAAGPNLALLQALEEAERQGARGQQETAVSRAQTERRDASGSHSWDQLTQAGTFMGSPSYASPEQIQGQAAGPSSDIFSLGILAWELLTGEHPFPGEGRLRMRAIVDGSRRDLKGRGLPSGTAELFRGMLEAHPFKRPTAAKVAETLGHLIRPRNVLRWVAASVLGALLLAGVLAWTLGRGVIADLTRQHPARLAILPFANLTGQPTSDAYAYSILPEMLEAALREQPKLAPLSQDLLGRARRELRLATAGLLNSQEQARLVSALGAQLVLRGSLARSPGGAVALKWELRDAKGTLRQAGEEQEAGDASLIPLALARKVSARLVKAVDPFQARAGARLPEVPAQALEAYVRGMDLVEHGDFKAAAPAFQAAALLAPDFPPAVLGYARCLGRLAEANPEPVLQWARWAARAQGNRAQEMLALHHLCIRHQARGQWEASAKAGREALEIARALGEVATEAGLHATFGVSFQRQHKPQEAEAEYQTSLAMFQAQGDRLSSTRVLNNLAVLDKERGNLKAAETHIQAALKTVQDYGDAWGEAIYTNNLGDLALAQEGGLDRAEALFKKARTLREAIGDQSGLTYTLMGLANVYQARGDLDRATDMTRQYLDLAHRMELRPLEALALYNLGELRRLALDYEAARGFYRQSLLVHQNLKDATMEAHCLAGEAECLAREGRRSQARTLLERGLAVSSEETPYILRAQAWLARGEGRTEEARALFTKALGAARTQAPEIARELKEALR